jgi:hypothetical protein
VREGITEREYNPQLSLSRRIDFIALLEGNVNFQGLALPFKQPPAGTAGYDKRLLVPRGNVKKRRFSVQHYRGDAFYWSGGRRPVNDLAIGRSISYNGPTMNRPGSCHERTRY